MGRLGYLPRATGEPWFSDSKHRGVEPAEVAGETSYRQGVDNPLGRIEVVPLRAVPVVAGVRMVVVVIALAETDK